MSRVVGRGWLLGVVLGCAAGSWAQKPIALTEPKTPLLPDTIGEWKQTSASPTGNDSGLTLTTVNKAALEECNPQRSAVQTYTRNAGGAVHTVHLEAIEFADRTGAESCFTLVAKPDMKVSKALGDLDAVGEDAILFRSGPALVLAAPATEADLKTLAPLAVTLPKAFGNSNVEPILPKLLPRAALVPGSVKYALGAQGYMSEGGVLPAVSLEWDKSAEAVTGTYSGKAGSESLTIVSYPTPEIASAVVKRVQSELAAMGPRFATAKARRERVLLVVASGAWPAAEAQKLIDSVQLHEQLAIDKGAPPPDFNNEVHKTVSLLVSILVFSGALMVAAVVLAIFFGGGRAMLRVMRGKPPAVEAEFLSLHLDPSNAPARFSEDK